MTALILYHKHPTSARTRFLQMAQGNVVGIDPLPTLSSYIEDADDVNETVVMHPGGLLKQAEGLFELDGGTLEVDTEFEEYVDTPDGNVRVYLAHFTTMDPPFDAVEAKGAKFIPLTDARQLPDTELLLLRKAYELVLGG